MEHRQTPRMIGEYLLEALAASILIVTFLERDEILGAAIVDHHMRAIEPRRA